MLTIYLGIGGALWVDWSRPAPAGPHSFDVPRVHTKTSTRTECAGVITVTETKAGSTSTVTVTCESDAPEAERVPSYAIR
jgi:hypothetical protein